MDRHWFLTWTCYGTWLPGNSRGFVGNNRDPEGRIVTHNLPGTPYDAHMPLLKDAIRARMTGPPVALDRGDADALIGQYRETCRIRHWKLEAASVMFNHTHVVVGVMGDPDPDSILETFKNWATRAVKTQRPLPKNGTFWTAKGSTRKVSDESGLAAVVIYVVKKQPNPLAVWYDREWQRVLDEYEASRVA